MENEATKTVPHKVIKKKDRYVIKGKISMEKFNEKKKTESEGCEETQAQSSPPKADGESKNAHKTMQLCLIIRSICALLNSGGGKLKLQVEGSSTRMQISKLVRIIEQKVYSFVDVPTYANFIKWDINRLDKLVVHIDNPGRFFTLNYNFYLPTNTQVLSLPPSLTGCSMNATLRLSSPQPSVKIGSHQNHFVQYEETALFEGDTVQLKNVECVNAKCVTLADRLTGKTNKFTCYVSAFANHRGGNIYYGITDEGIINGEKVKDKEKLCKELSKKINAMIWPCNGPPRRGKDWEVYFEPVKSSGNENQRHENLGNKIPEIFVVVVYVARFPGGVFTDKPKSYHVVDCAHDGLFIQEIEFSEWKNRLLNEHSRPQSGPHVEGNLVSTRGIKWSSTSLEKCCNVLQGILQTLINNGKWSELDRKVEEMEKKKGTADDVKLFLLGKKVNAAFRKGEFHKAEFFRKEFAESLKKSANSSIFEVINRYLLSAMGRCTGDYEKCYQIAKESLHLVEKISVSFLSASFYALLATIAGILASKQHARNRAMDLLDEAKEYCTTALNHYKKSTNPETVDIAQKVYINLAMFHFGFALSGDIIHKSITDEDFDEGKAMCKEITQTGLDNGCTKTIFRDVQNRFVEAIFCYRVSQRNNCTKGRMSLKQAFWHAEQAKKIAQECNFDEMTRYAQTLVAFFTAKLLLNHRSEKNQIPAVQCVS